MKLAGFRSVAHAAVVLVAPFILHSHVVSTAAAAQPDPSSRALTVVNAGWTTYEQGMENLRSNIRKELTDAENAAISDKPRLEAVAAARAAFLSSGMLPDLGDADQVERWREMYAQHASELLKKYERAITTIKDDESPVRAALLSELDQLRTTWDLTPWKDALAKGSAEAERTLGEAGTPLTLGIEGEREFRLQVKARRTAGSGTLRMDVPDADGGIVTLVGQPRADGTLEVALTAWEGQLGALRGVAGAATPTGRKSGAKRELVLRAADATFIVDSVQYKQVRRQSVPAPGAVQKRVVKQPEPPAKNKPELLRAGMSGVGDCIHHDRANTTVRAKVTVRSVSGNKADLSVVLPGTGESFFVTCTMRGNNLTVVNVEQTSPPRGSPRFRVNEVNGGSGTLNSGSMDLSWSVRGSSGGAGKNREWTVRLMNVALN